MSGVFAGLVRPAYRSVRRTATAVLFERRYGVRTDEVVPLDAFGLEHAERERYGATGWLTLRAILPRRTVTADDVFVDLGSGMGRVVLQAAMMYPFRRVLGVEIAGDLHRIAEANIAANRHRLAGRDVSLVHADVLDFEIPDDVTVAFLYNPFLGSIFRTVVDRLVESVDRNPRRLRIVYGNPREEEALLATGRCRPVRTLPGLRPGREWSRSNSWRLYEVLPRPAGERG
ncbi:hypothetical protein [Pseudonocardia spirodelae]|uniref:Histone-lysine N-methyltransferase, H3 lysine-79 specific n=1 Tax=Pseudonocardia spirodelae TaxID=3133431 RepID=A0ABU8T2V2_9PSEU